MVLREGPRATLAEQIDQRIVNEILLAPLFARYPEMFRYEDGVEEIAWVLPCFLDLGSFRNFPS